MKTAHGGTRNPWQFISKPSANVYECKVSALWLSVTVCVLMYQVLACLSQVPNMHVYARQKIPERFHYKGGRFVSPLTLVAEPGWFIIQVTDNISFVSLHH